MTPEIAEALDLAQMGLAVAVARMGKDCGCGVAGIYECPPHRALAKVTEVIEGNERPALEEVK